ncbi:MAG: glycosyltransferase family 4 protein [Thermoanaerobaculia bacterium]|nr:glycosyltransferase family 4 protein [Thermoanaerobaculia bacterium]
MKVVVPALHWFPDVPGGAAQLARGHARWMAARGHDVWVVAQAATPDVPEREDADGVHVLRYRLRPFGAFDPRRGRMHQDAARDILLRHVGRSADAVHGHALLPHVAALELYGDRAVTSYSLHSPVRHEFRASGRGRGTVERFRLGLSGALLHRIEAGVFEDSRYLTAESEFTRRLVRESHGAAVADRMRVVPGWVDSRFRPAADRRALLLRLGLPADRPVLFTLRRLVPRMGVDLLLGACARLVRKGRAFHLVVAGEGPLRESLEAQARAEGLGEAVTFPGRLPVATLPEWYAAADAFVLPTAELECFGLIALEAMASGRTCLATPAGAIPEVVGRFEPAWLARDVSLGALEELLDAYFDGVLPSRDPAALHEAVVAEYGEESVLPRLERATLGDS